MFCLGLTEIINKNISGEKAYNLHLVNKLGMQTPESLCLNAESFFRFVEFNNWEENLNAVENVLAISDSKKKLWLIRKIQADALKGTIPCNIWDEIKENVTEMFGNRKLIVRSSALGEDSDASSFAGQLDSIITDGSLSSLREGLLKCWASYWSERCIYYQLAKNIKLKGMGIIIQELIRSDISGVLFTGFNNGNGDYSNKMVAEYCSGFGDKLVSGKINPGRFEISKKDFSYDMISYPEASPSPQPYPPPSESVIKELGRMALALENKYRAHQDIEWTVDTEGRLYILQTRPVTTALVNQSQNHEKLTVWSNVNVNENYPAPITPFLFSIAKKGYYYYFRNLGKSFGISEKIVQSMDQPLSEIIGTHGARMYYNLTNIYACLNVLPLSSKIIKYWNNFIGVYNAQERQVKENSHFEYRQFLSHIIFIIRMLVVTSWTFLFLPLRIRRFVADVDSFVSNSKNGKINANIDDYANEFNGFLDIRFNKWRNASLADAASMFSYGLLKSCAKRWLEDEMKHDDIFLHNSLLQGITGLESNIPSQKIWELSERVRNDHKLCNLFTRNSTEELITIITENEAFRYFNKEMNFFLDNWGFRCSGELMLSEPNYQDNPEKLIDILKSYLHIHSVSPFEKIKIQENKRIETMKEVKLILKKHHFGFMKIFMIQILIRLAHGSIRYREKVRSRQALLYNQCRKTLASIGSTLTEHDYIEQADDIFYLEYPEILKAIADFTMNNIALSADLKIIIGQRRQDFATQSTYSPPETVVLRPGEVYQESNDDPIGKSLNKEDMLLFQQRFLKGISASSGRVSGKAIILKNVRDIGQISDNKILITKQTDPGWAAIFPLILGIVMERGGMLSHGAIIAREYGIPAVVGIKNATSLIKQDQQILVDGDHGTIEILS